MQAVKNSSTHVNAKFNSTNQTVKIQKLANQQIFSYALVILAIVFLKAKKTLTYKGRNVVTEIKANEQ